MDAFHVVQDANRRLDECRKVEQDALKVGIPRYPLLKQREKLTPRQVQQLEWIRRKFPALYELYQLNQLKEELRDILRGRDVDKGRERIYCWFLAPESASNAEGWVWAKTIRSWRQEILNLIYFAARGQRHTNGYIEGKITLVKMIERLGFGFRNRESFLKRAFIGGQVRDWV
ncbi:MAG: transposase [Firmicutes bacterium]|nr:transposase [Candidatus Fermentithermobacillaceae bacterium]